ncbi:9748_t:CDS:1, partial [Racocetra fulgida]
EALKEVNNTRQKYGRVQGIIRKALDIAIATNSYNKWIGICHEFILDKENKGLDIMTDDIECNIKNLVISI